MVMIITIIYFMIVVMYYHVSISIIIQCNNSLFSPSVGSGCSLQSWRWLFWSQRRLRHICRPRRRPTELLPRRDTKIPLPAFLRRQFYVIRRMGAKYGSASFSSIKFIAPTEP